MAGPHTHPNVSGVFINDSGIFIYTSVVSCTLPFAPAWTPALAQAPAFTFAFVSVLDSLVRYIDKDLQRASKLALELFVKGKENGQLYANSALCK